MPAHHRAGASQTAAVRAALSPVVEGLGLVVEEVVLTPAGNRRVLRVVVDVAGPVGGSTSGDGLDQRDQMNDAEGPAGPAGLSLDDIAEASRAISQALDVDDLMGATPYVLEVTTPGVDRPLVERRHFSRNVGRLVIVTLADGSTVQGRVRAVGPVLVLTVAGPKKGTSTERELGWESIVRGAVQVEFSRSDDVLGTPPAGDPDDPGDLDASDDDLDDLDDGEC